MPKWELIEDGCHFATIEADTLEQACERARATYDGDSLQPLESTVWCKVHVVRADDGDDSDDPLSDTIRITVDPTEPPCAEGRRKHRWHAPHSVVGGIEENPGVWGHGGGVTIHEVCKHCGCHRHTDTWAQDPEDGSQGHTSIRYEQADPCEGGW